MFGGNNMLLNYMEHFIRQCDKYLLLLISHFEQHRLNISMIPPFETTLEGKDDQIQFDWPF